MRHWIVSAAVVMISSSFALAAAPAPVAPTAPASDPQPAAAQATAMDAPTKVLVAPFTEVNEQQQPDWISRAIQQSVADELSSLASVDVVPNNSAALPSTAQAKGAGIKYIVRASIQRLNGEIRVTGRVQNVDDGKTIGGFKATGPQSQLFAIEDSISQQLKGVIAPMEGDLQDVRSVGTSTAVGGPRNTLTTTPGRGVFEGSDLQRALEDRDYLRRVQRRVPEYTEPVYYPPQPTYYPPTYPGYGGYGYGYGYGYGNGCYGDNNVVIIGTGGGTGGFGGGGSVTPSVRGPSLQTVQTQRLRDAAVYPGQSGNFIGPAPARPPGIPTKHPTMGR
jgi:TolB-like protein